MAYFSLATRDTHEEESYTIDILLFHDTAVDGKGTVDSQSRVNKCVITQGDSCIIVFIQIGPDVLDFGDIFDEDVRLIL